MHGTFAWSELATEDVEAAIAFYRDTLGWTFERFDLPDGAYWVAKSGQTMVGGIGGLETAAETGTRKSAWYSFIRVDKLDERFERALERGAHAIQRPHDVPGVGRVAVLRDPTGAVIGWME